MLPRMGSGSLSALEVAALVRSGRLSARQAVAGALERAALASHLNAFITLAYEQALAQADLLDERLARGEDPGPLAGVPVAVKDNIATAGIRTTAASASLLSYVPPRDATVVARLRSAGAVIIGKTNLDEFGMGSTSENSHFGRVENPSAPGRVVGGSSGGSAAAVAAGIVPLALGTDTGGSIRQPAAFTSTTGFKPTYGTLSRWGVLAYASSLDQVGVIAHHAADIRAAMQVMSGHDPLDSTSLRKAPDFSAAPSPARLRVGVVRQLSFDGNSPEVRAGFDDTVSALRRAGAELGEAELPHARHGLASYYLVATAEASSNLSRYDGTLYGSREGQVSDGQVAVMMKTRGRAFGREVRRRVLMGTYALSAGYYDAFYGRALRVRRLIAEDFERAFEAFDVLAMPTAPSPPFAPGRGEASPLEVYLGDVATCLANLAGLPAISVPARVESTGLPVGVQLLAPPLADARLLDLATTLESRASEG